MQIIWLCSWYPNTEDFFRGDFIQRQAMATSLFVQVDILHIVFCDREEKSVRKVNENLTEHIFYHKQKNSLADRLQLLRTHQEFLSEYKVNHGLPDLVHVQIPLPAGLAALRWQRKFDLPFILTEHYGIYTHTVADNYDTRNFLFRYFVKKIIQKCTVFLPVSNQLGRDVNTMVTPKKFVAVPNVVDTNLFHFSDKVKSPVLQFIHISNMAPLKNVDGILLAASALAKRRQDFHITFAGRDVPQYKMAAQQSRIEDLCTFLPEMPYTEIAALVRKSNVGLLFSTSESQSCVVLEWLCSGLPVIASAVGGVVELLNEENGILVTSEDIQQLEIAMDQMIDNYHRYNCKGIAATASAKYSYEAVGKQISDIYKQTIH